MKKKRTLLFDSSLIYFICLTFFVLMRILTQALVIYFHIKIDDTLDYILNISSQIGLMFALPVLLLSLFQKQSLKKTFVHLGYEKIGFKPIIISVGLGFLCYLLNRSVASFFATIIKVFGYETLPGISTTVISATYSTEMFLITVLTSCLLPAFCEETLHRGLLLKGFYSLGLTKALVLSSILFGLMHLNINQFFYATILGLIIGVVCVVSKNILPAMIIHFMNNFLSCYLPFARINNLFGSKFFSAYSNYLMSSDNIIEFFFKNFLVLSALIFTIVFFVYLLLKETRIKKVNKMLNEIIDINRQYNPNFQNDINFMNMQFLRNLLNQYNIKNINTVIMPETEIKPIKPNAFQLTIIFSCLLLGTLVTIFTFVWGLL